MRRAAETRRAAIVLVVRRGEGVVMGVGLEVELEGWMKKTERAQQRREQRRRRRKREEREKRPADGKTKLGSHFDGIGQGGVVGLNKARGNERLTARWTT